MRVKIKVYACRYCEQISANPDDFIPAACAAGDLKNMAEYVCDQLHVSTLFDYLQESASKGMTCQEALDALEKEYEEHLSHAIRELFNDCDDYWCDEVELEVDGQGFGSIAIKAV